MIEAIQVRNEDICRLDSFDGIYQKLDSLDEYVRSQFFQIKWMLGVIGVALVIGVIFAPSPHPAPCRHQLQLEKKAASVLPVKQKQHFSYVEMSEIGHHVPAALQTSYSDVRHFGPILHERPSRNEPGSYQE